MVADDAPARASRRRRRRAPLQHLGSATRQSDTLTLRIKPMRIGEPEAGGAFQVCASGDGVLVRSQGDRAVTRGEDEAPAAWLTPGRGFVALVLDMYTPRHS
jgi:hypothetical protein